MKKILIADFSKGNEKAYVRGLYQHDYGAILKVTGIEYAEIIRVDFAGTNDEKAHPVVALQEPDGGFCVKIPKENTDKAGELSAYIYVTDAEAGFTIKEVILPIIKRIEADPDPSGEKTDPFAEAIEEIKKNAKAAGDSAASAAESEKTASESATQAEKSAVKSQKSAEAAAASEQAAATSATAAAQSASQSRESATAAQTAADQATESATAAAESATTATQLAENTARSAANASGSAESASQSAETAKTAADTAEKFASAAQQAAGSASESASTATAAAQTATTAAGKAAGSATLAGQSAEMAGQKATAAETSAGNTAVSAAGAAKSATAAGDSASAAKVSEIAAGEAAQQAQEQAERITDSAEQIEKNKAGVAAIIIEESATGSNIAITDSAEMPLRGLKLFGKSTQVTTTGAQLISVENGPITQDGVTFSSEYGKATIDGTASTETMFMIERALTVQEGKTYTISCTELAGIKDVAIYSDRLTVTKNSPTAAAKMTGTVSVYVYIKNGAKFSNDELYITVEEGDVSHQWEPYTGGKPSPSPDWPQEIISAGDSGNIEVNASGKNLFNPELAQDNKYQNYNISTGDFKIGANQQFWITGLIKVKSNKTYIFGKRIEGGVFYKDVDNPITNTILPPCAGTAFTTPPNCQYMCVNISKNVAQFKENIMLEEGFKSTNYQPYHSPQSFNIHTPNGFRGIPVDSGGNYTDESGQQWICDEVDFERGVYVQRIWTGELDGSNDELWSAYMTPGLEGFSCPVLTGKMSRKKGFTNSYTVETQATKTESVCFGVNSDRIYVHNSRFYDAELDDKGLSNFKAYLAEHPLVVMTYLDTSVETPLTADQIAAYKTLTTHKTTTLISNDAGAGMEVTYVADQKTYIDNKFAELSQALIASASEAE